MRTVSQSEALRSFPSLLEEVKNHSVVILGEDRELGVLISMEDFELIRKTKSKQLLELCDTISDEVAGKAKMYSLSLEDVEKELLAD
jgi:PHD/YefM family antitoxin component YafN of YafNO toxin-antitoxin module